MVTRLFNLSVGVKLCKSYCDSPKNDRTIVVLNQAEKGIAYRIEFVGEYLLSMPL
ncbi:hypothetical protein F5613_002570 [Macellibacteroides fermentans]|jgi:hypothetical protein|uniref:Uncharacterized protein n=1 Tax=Macellibacteroides fermentans TaxID=879969 RepID=A0A8E2A2M9_9PORP|nr:hypothetical protein [Macellibacteroides fermentans]